MVRTRQNTRTQSSPNKLIEKTQKIKKNKREEQLEASWDDIKLVNKKKFQYNLPTNIELEEGKGSFSLIEAIKSGGQAEVFKAQQLFENQQIHALKLFVHKPQKKYLESIEKSIPINKNLLEYYDVGYYKDYLVNVTELCDSDLKKEIDENDHSFQSFEEREIMAIDIIKQLLNGYFALLNHGIIHRDLKPGNILIKDGDYKIADFGFAAYTLNTTNTKVGTPGYESPQVHLNNPYTSKCDIHSIGVIFYEIIFNELPGKRKEKEMITLPANSISKEAKNFIVKCSEYEEKYRLSWIQVYNHKIFKGYFQNIVKQLEMIEELNQLKQQVLKKIPKYYNQKQKCRKYFNLRDFLHIFKKPYFTQMKLALVFCMLLKNSKKISGKEILDNLEKEFSRVRMAQNGHVACLLTIYTQLIYFPVDFQFFNSEEISFEQYHNFLKDIDPTIDENDVVYSFNILKEEGDVIKTSSFKELLKFKFLSHENQQK